MKKCSKCKKNKDKDYFHNNKRMKDGKQRICKVCTKIKDSKHWVNSGKKQPARVSKKNLSKFKNSKLRELKDKISTFSKKIREVEDLKTLVKVRDRGFLYEKMNHYNVSFHIIDGTYNKLISSRGNYVNGKAQWAEFDEIAKEIEEGKKEYVCECCFKSKKIKHYQTTYELDAYKTVSSEKWRVKDIFINVFVYCFNCIEKGNTPRDKEIKRLYEEKFRMSVMLNNYANASEEDIKQRYKWSLSKNKHESKFLSNIDRSEDGKYLYIMQWKDVYKIGISNKPLTRLSSIKASLPGNNEVSLIYICKPYKGRCVDNEQLIHKSLKDYRADVSWKNGKKSREFFRCDLDLIKLAVSEQCYIEDVKELMA